MDLWIYHGDRKTDTNIILPFNLLCTHKYSRSFVDSLRTVYCTLTGANSVKSAAFTQQENILLFCDGHGRRWGQWEPQRWVASAASRHAKYFSDGFIHPPQGNCVATADHTKAFTPNLTAIFRSMRWRWDASLAPGDTKLGGNLFCSLSLAT